MAGHHTPPSATPQPPPLPFSANVRDICVTAVRDGHGHWIVGTVIPKCRMEAGSAAFAAVQRCLQSHRVDGDRMAGIGSPLELLPARFTSFHVNIRSEKDTLQELG